MTTLFEFITNPIKVATILHLFGVILGVGSALITDMLFFKFLKDYRISKTESSIMESLSKMVWIALIILVISGVVLYLGKSDVLNSSGKFLTKVVALIVLIINGVLLNVVIQPQMFRIHFKGNMLPTKERRVRRLAFLLGSISMASWVFIFILGGLRNVSVPFWPTLSTYFGILIVGGLVSQYVEGHFWKIYKH